MLLLIIPCLATLHLNAARQETHSQSLMRAEKELCCVLQSSSCRPPHYPMNALCFVTPCKAKSHCFEERNDGKRRNIFTTTISSTYMSVRGYCCPDSHYSWLYCIRQKLCSSSTGSFRFRLWSCMTNSLLLAGNRFVGAKVAWKWNPNMGRPVSTLRVTLAWTERSISLHWASKYHQGDWSTSDLLY